jgi:transcriptional regulator with GAF, ATPase, and Fis domain
MSMAATPASTPGVAHRVLGSPHDPTTGRETVEALLAVSDRARADAEARVVRVTHDLEAALREVAVLRQQVEARQFHDRQSAANGAAPTVVGRSAAIRRVLALAEQVAPTSATVLLTGETGTGKERFATLIHEASPRHARPMVRVNCSAIPTALIESELFGREKGAYTGALSRQIGRFELANGSTLFLDEVGDLPLDVQVKLLRVLQERTIERLGSPRPVDVDVRIVAATNRDLEQAVRDGSFRSDLYYRLHVFPIEVPPLRERRDDIPALVTSLVEEIGEAMGKRFDGVDRRSLEDLQRGQWPGNVRELRNVLERAMILSPGPVLQVDVAAVPTLAGRLGAGAAPSHRLEDVERAHILHVLQQVHWRIKGADSASVRLGLKPSTLYFRMKKLGIRRG